LMSICKGKKGQDSTLQKREIRRGGKKPRNEGVIKSEEKSAKRDQERKGGNGRELGTDYANMTLFRGPFQGGEESTVRISWEEGGEGVRNNIRGIAKEKRGNKVQGLSFFTRGGGQGTGAEKKSEGGDRSQKGEGAWGGKSLSSFRRQSTDGTKKEAEQELKKPDSSAKRRPKRGGKSFFQGGQGVKKNASCRRLLKRRSQGKKKGGDRVATTRGAVAGISGDCCGTLILKSGGSGQRKENSIGGTTARGL